MSENTEGRWKAWGVRGAGTECRVSSVINPPRAGAQPTWLPSSQGCPDLVTEETEQRSVVRGWRLLPEAVTRTLLNAFAHGLTFAVYNNPREASP